MLPSDGYGAFATCAKKIGLNHAQNKTSVVLAK
jgi:hypothetical protein